MANGIEREKKFRDAALVLADDAMEAVQKLSKLIHAHQHERVQALAADIQTTARDLKWLARRLPRE